MSSPDSFFGVLRNSLNQNRFLDKLTQLATQLIDFPWLAWFYSNEEIELLMQQAQTIKAPEKSPGLTARRARGRQVFRVGSRAVGIGLGVSRSTFGSFGLLDLR